MVMAMNQVIPENWREHLTSTCDEYCLLTGVSQATVGNKIANDADFISRLKDGKGCTVDTYRKAVNWFKANWPVQRPTRKRTEGKENRA